MRTLYRVFPWRPEARPGSPGHPLSLPRGVQGKGRIDNPDLFTALYVAETRVGAIGAGLARFPVWSELIASVPNVPGALRSLAILELDRSAILDLDRPEELVDRALRPSRVVTPDRETTQSWARSIFEERTFDGVSWWSELDSRWTIFGLWNLRRLRVASVDVLSMDDDGVREAASILGRPIVDSRT